MERGEDREQARDLLRALRSDPAQGWPAFLDRYSPIILQVVGLFEKDQDHIADCFLFISEQLSKNNFRRLLQFQPEGAASLATWLRAVVRRLCIDWHRKEFGRSRVFECIRQLDSLDQAVFQKVHEECLSADRALPLLRHRFPQLTPAAIEESCQRIQRTLSPRQLWLISLRKPRLVPLDELLTDEGQSRKDRIRDRSPDPEALAIEQQEQAALAEALAGLTSPERLLIRLRFEQELTLEQVARLTGLPDPQSADRRLKQILAGLRTAIAKKTTNVRVRRQAGVRDEQT